jgi:CNT family concentrative nucleoside transporter
MDSLPMEERQGSDLVKRSHSHAADSFGEKAPLDVPMSVDGGDDDDAEQERRKAFYAKLRPVILICLAGVILGWWISATVLKATRHRW